MELNILGTVYSMDFIARDDDPSLTDGDGFCDFVEHKIVIAADIQRETSMSEKARTDYIKRIKRHEIIHAYFCESGLCRNWEHKEYGQEETTVDWIAIQFPKLLNTFKEADAL